MDPNANIDEQLELAKKIAAIMDAAAPDGSFTADQRANVVSMGFRLAELVESLDHWITGGGFRPERWRGPSTEVVNFARRMAEGEEHGTRKVTAAR